MDMLRINMVRKNKLILLIFLLMFSLLSIFMPHGLIETHEHNEHEGLLKHVINNSALVSNIKKVLRKVRTVLLKIFKLTQIISNAEELINTRLVLFNIRISYTIILHLISVLCFYFHGGKFKINKHSDLLLLMGA